MSNIYMCSSSKTSESGAIDSVYSRMRECGIHTFFSDITHFFRPKWEIPALKYV